MSSAPSSVRVYVCSALQDMRAEREYLSRSVFATLEPWFRERGLRLEWDDPNRLLDLEPWLATEMPEFLQLRLRLQKIDRCLPFFLTLLGERLGPPLPPDVGREHAWLSEYPGCSLTQAEIVHGLLRPTDQPLRGFVYLRDPSILERMPAEQRAAFVEEDPEAAARLADLKAALRRADRTVVREYGCQWDAEHQAVTGLESLGQMVANDICSAVEQLHGLGRRRVAAVVPPQAPVPMARPAKPMARPDSEALPLESPSVARPPYLDENVQFTVYRPRVVAPQRWYPLLAFAHLSERPPDAPPGTPDPVEEVYRQAKQILGDQAKDYQDVTQDSRAAVPREGEITLVPEMPGVEFNPPRRTFLWQEAVHREEFRLRASPELDGKTVRGRLTVYLGHIILADVSLSLRVDSNHRPSSGDAVEAEKARPYRKIFASYSHRDLHIVQQVEQLARTFGDAYLRDWTQLRSGEVWNERLLELIRQADVFQLFWSKNSMHSPYCRREWEYALSLGRPYFVRPTYWEEPLPMTPDGSLPPEQLRQLHFQRLYTEALTHPVLAEAEAVEEEAALLLGEALEAEAAQPEKLEMHLEHIPETVRRDLHPPGRPSSEDADIPFGPPLDDSEELVELGEDDAADELLVEDEEPREVVLDRPRRAEAPRARKMAFDDAEEVLAAPGRSWGKARKGRKSSSPVAWLGLLVGLLVILVLAALGVAYALGLLHFG